MFNFNQLVAAYCNKENSSRLVNFEHTMKSFWQTYFSNICSFLFSSPFVSNLKYLSGICIESYEISCEWKIRFLSRFTADKGKQILKTTDRSFKIICFYHIKLQRLKCLASYSFIRYKTHLSTCMNYSP